MKEIVSSEYIRDPVGEPVKHTVKISYEHETYEDPEDDSEYLRCLSDEISKYNGKDDQACPSECDRI